MAVAKDDRGRHAGERALAGGHGVCFRTDQAKGIGHAGLDGEVVHLVVEENAGAGDHDLRAEGRIDRGGAGDPVAVGVGHGEVRGVLLAEDIGRGVGRVAVGGDGEDGIQFDARGERLRVILAEQPARDGDEIGIAEPVGTVGKGEFHALRNDVGAGVLVELRKFEGFEHVEDFEDAMRRRNWVAESSAVISAPR